MAAARALSRPGLPAIASLAVNALLIAGLLTMGLQEKRRIDGPSLSVLSLAALKGSDQGEAQAPTADASTPSPPAQAKQKPAEQAPASAVVPPPPLPLPIPLPAPAAQPANPLPPVAAAATPAAARSPASSSATSPAAAAQGSSNAPATPQRKGVAEGLDADAPAGKSLAYAARVRSWLYAHKIYPRRARMQHEEGVVRVRFILDRAGALIEGVIVGASGKASLDEEAMAMMRRASPYPRAPEEVSGSRLEFTAPIEFTLPV